MISVVIPTYREAENIGPLIEEIKETLSGYENEIIIVDDNSDDGTREEVERKAVDFDNIVLIAREARKGIGSAYKEGFAEADGDIVVQTDADFSHPPSHITDLVETVESGSDVAVGSRYVDQGTRNDPVHRRINPIIGSYLYKYLVGSPVKDVTSGFKAYNREALNDLLENSEEFPDGFHFQAASLMFLVDSGYSVEETPIDFMPRRAGEAKYGIGDLIDNVILLLKLTSDHHLR